MSRILIFGNSGSGKSTLARTLCDRGGLAHLDLDTLAWESEPPPTRRPLRDSERDLRAFTERHAEPGWVVEGCYADLLGMLLEDATEMHFLNPGVERCVENCRSRPFEPHKYRSKEAQDANLAILLDWVRQYPERDDEFSLAAHRRLFERFDGRKVEHRENIGQDSPDPL